MTQSTTISVEELREQLERGPRVTLLDIRDAGERAEWSIPGSLHADLYAALRSGDTDGLDRLPFRPEMPVVVVCAAGRTSRIATDRLRAQGFDARSLTGGMRAWSLAWNTAEVVLPGSGLRVTQIRRTGPEVYRRIAAERGLAIRAVMDTHIHADHLSRSRLLAEGTGAVLYLPQQNRTSFPAHWLEEGDTIALGSSRIEVLRTPGHTPESLCYRAGDSVLFTGDTLFLDAVGRPDLEAAPDETRERARALHRSLRRIAGLPGGIVVLPGHTSDPVPFDNQPLAAPLERVLARTPLFGSTEEEFATRILQRVPPGTVPGEDPTELEAGANRCVVS